MRITKIPIISNKFIKILLSLNSNLILDYSNKEYKSVNEYTAIKRCRIYYTVHTSETAYLTFKVNDVTIGYSNINNASIPRCTIFADLNKDDIFQTVINSGSVSYNNMTIIPYK